MDREGTRHGEHNSTVPLDSLARGHLRFANGAHRVIMRADGDLRDLYRARWGNHLQATRVRGSVVSIWHLQVRPHEWRTEGTGRFAEVELSTRIPWRIEIRSGASRLRADVRALWLESLSLDGGANHLELLLPAPAGTVVVAILGGASNVAIGCPTCVAMRLRVDGGATLLSFDDRRIRAAGNTLDLQDRTYERAVNRYDVAITGGANNVSIKHQLAPRASAWECRAGD